MHGTVVSTTQLTPALVRIVLGGGDLAELEMPDATDAYINIAIPPTGAAYGPVFDTGEVKESYPREQQPARRRYTVRAWDAVRHELSVDFVVHGDEGVAGPWAANASQGDVLVFDGPHGGYLPNPDAAFHLLVGDESALPAIAASVERLAPAATAFVRLVCDDASHEVPLDSPADLDLQWLHRSRAADPVSLLADSVKEIEFPDGPICAFIHGEADEIREIRRHLLSERGVERAAMSCSPYWRRTMTDEAWRAIKRDYVQAMEADA